MNDVYEKLAKHLDDLPTGFPATDSGVELRILKRLFLPREAAVATSLSMKPQPVSTIAKRLNEAEQDMAQLLESMSKKGLIIRSSRGAQNLYMAAQFLVGIWEYHVNDLDVELIKDFNEYAPHLVNTQLNLKTKQIRVIPISKSISAEMRIMPYEEAESIIKEQSKIVVAPCICRREHQMLGKGCDYPIESCLIFGGAAYFYEGNGIGRSISGKEALEILNMGQEAGLVIQPGNSQKPSNICLCCSCCCQILKSLKNLDHPAKIACANYYAEVNEEDCTACGVCEERCQMDAITINDAAVINTDRCIGCGLCVTTCDTQAIKLLAKDEAEKTIPPATLSETYMNIARERGKI